MIMKEDLLKYYEQCRSHYTAYHNHKEISAWAGLVLFVFISGFVNLIDIPYKFKIQSAIALSLFVIAISILVFKYIENQLDMKDMASSYVAAAISIITDVSAGRIEETEYESYFKVERSIDCKAQSKLVLPIKFLKKAEKFDTKARGFQDRTRTMMFGLLFLVAILVIASKWIQAISQ